MIVSDEFHVFISRDDEVQAICSLQMSTITADGRNLLLPGRIFAIMRACEYEHTVLGMVPKAKQLIVETCIERLLYSLYIDIYFYVIDEPLLAQLLLFSNQFLNFQRGHATTASTRDCLPVPFILNITGGEHALYRSLRRTRHGDDIPIRVSLQLRANKRRRWLVACTQFESMQRVQGGLKNIPMA